MGHRAKIVRILTAVGEYQHFAPRPDTDPYGQGVVHELLIKVWVIGFEGGDVGGEACFLIAYREVEPLRSTAQFNFPARLNRVAPSYRDRPGNAGAVEVVQRDSELKCLCLLERRWHSQLGHRDIRNGAGAGRRATDEPYPSTPQRANRPRGLPITFPSIGYEDRGSSFRIGISGEPHQGGFKVCRLRGAPGTTGCREIGYDRSNR